ncbi:MAG: cystathionine gamma-lyase [Kangiellaceae bacterium]|jgi:cystathionine gamma-lyase|nr:cystathionine gamma-lyase [Kangiellaceae bacterium]
MTKSLKPETKLVHAGSIGKKSGSPFAQGPVFTSAFHLQGDIDSGEYQYARFHNPTWSSLESALAELEAGEVRVFPSGMAAVAAVLTALTESGDTILLPDDGYYATRAYADNFLVKYGVKVITAPTSKLMEVDLTEVKLMFIESPSNPMLDIVDIAKLCAKAKESDTLVAIDNTTMTPLGQKPLALGADISMCSDTKALSGHSDLLFGHVATNNPELLEAMTLWRKLSGNIAGPMEAWLVQRSMMSLDVRLERMTGNAQKIAELLERHPAVENIQYPGLPSHHQHALAKQQMANFGFIISFDLVSETKANQFLQKSDLIVEATSFGGMHTMAERRIRWGTDNVSPGLIRLSVGCENINDLMNDISESLNQL